MFAFSIFPKISPFLVAFLDEKLEKNLLTFFSVVLEKLKTILLSKLVKLIF